MLDISAIESGLPLAEKLYASRVNLGAVEGSPLQGLVGASGVNENIVSAVGGELQVRASLAAEITNAGDSMTGYSEHDQRMTDVLQQVVPGLLNQIAYARNEGAAVVEELAERVSAQIEQISLSSLAGASVEICKVPAILSDDAITEAAEQSRQQVLIDEPLNMDVAPLSGTEVRAMLLTGASATDAAISEFFRDYTDAELEAMWEAVYTYKYTQGGTLTTYLTGPKALFGCLFVFLTSLRMSAKIVDGANMSEQKYMDTVSNFRNQAARRLCNIIDETAAVLQNKQLIRSIDGLTVVVNEQVYKAFLNEGGSVDAVLGAAVLGVQADMTYQALTERRSEFEQAWKDQYLLSKTTIANKRYNAIKAIFVREFNHQCTEATDQEMPLADRQIAMHLFAKAVETISIEETSDIMMLTLRLLGESRFRGRSVCQFLSTIARIRKQDPDVSAADAASIAVIEYVSRWVASMITYERNTMVTTG